MAEERTDLSALTVARLRELARAAGVKGYSRLTRAALLDCLSGAGAPAPSAAPVPEPEVAAAPSSAVPVEAPTPVADEAWPFPNSYGVDRVVLLVRDPRWMFAYWDVSGATWQTIEHRGLSSAGGGWRRVLRLHDVTGTDGTPSAATLVHDLALSDDARDWYFQTPRAARDYLVQYGYLGPDGQFFLVAASNVVAVPRPVPSEQTDEAWGHLFAHEEAYRLSLAGHGAAGDEGVSSAQANQRLEEFLAEGLSSSLFLASPALV